MYRATRGQENPFATMRENTRRMLMSQVYKDKFDLLPSKMSSTMLPASRRRTPMGDIQNLTAIDPRQQAIYNTRKRAKSACGVTENYSYDRSYQSTSGCPCAPRSNATTLDFNSTTGSRSSSLLSVFSLDDTVQPASLGCPCRPRRVSTSSLAYGSHGDISGISNNSTFLSVYANNVPSSTPYSQVPQQRLISPTLSSNQPSYSNYRSTRNVAVVRYSPIQPNIYRHSNALISENAIIRREPKVKKKSYGLNYPITSDTFNIEYIDDIYICSKHLEQSLLLNFEFLNNYSSNKKYRAAVLNWLLKIQKSVHFSEIDYYMTVRLFDTVLASIPVPLNMYQLLVLTALFISFKVNGFNDCSISSLLSLCGGAYVKVQLQRMERKVLKILDFRISSIEPTIFVNYYLLKFRLENDQLVQFGTCYLLDLLSLIPEFSSVQMSVLAAAAINYVICRIRNQNGSIFEAYSDLDRNLMQYVTDRIAEQLARMSQDDYVFKEPYVKYIGQNKLCVSTRIF